VQAFPLSDVQAYEGHADVATMMIYVHHTPKLTGAVVGADGGRAEVTPAKTGPGG